MCTCVYISSSPVSFCHFLFYHSAVPFLPPGSTSSSTSDHWLVRLVGDSKRGSLISGGPSPGPPVPPQVPDSPELPVFGEEPPQVVETSRPVRAASHFTMLGSRSWLAWNPMTHDSVLGMLWKWDTSTQSKRVQVKLSLLSLLNLGLNSRVNKSVSNVIKHIAKICSVSAETWDNSDVIMQVFNNLSNQ